MSKRTRFCTTCQRQLPRRAYRKQCASCIKEDNGYVRGPVKHINWRGQVLWIQGWFRAVEKLEATR